MRRILTMVFAGVMLLLLAASPSVSAQSLSEENPWLERRVLNMAHQGGEIEAPSNTLFAFKTAREKGADVLELDVHATADRELVVIHDATVDRTTNGTGRIDSMTLEQVKALDAAYWFVPDCGTCHGRPDDVYAYRGYATGARPIPHELRDFEPNDFKVPTLREVLKAFPRKFINIEIKATAPETRPYEAELAALLKEFGRTTDTIVVSFHDHAVEALKLYAPEVSTAPGTAETGLFWASAQGPAPGTPTRHHALQVPIEFNGLEVVNPDFVDRAHANGLAVHVWTINDRPTMESLIETGVDGIMTDRPTLLEEVLQAADAEYRAPRGRRGRARRVP
jgi:glycerophosphoryl diester phosphodiesterase